MQALKFGLALCLGFAAHKLAASTVPEVHGFLEADVVSSQSERYAYGQVQFDRAAYSIRLNLQPSMPDCQKGLSCTQALPQARTWILENAVKNIDDCQIVTYEASIDERAQDGALIRVQLVDNRANQCPTFIALPPSELRLEQRYFDRLESIEVSELDSFKGEALKITP